MGAGATGWARRASERRRSWNITPAERCYDWIDYLGRRSPRRLTPGAEVLETGQRFLAFELIAFERGSHLTGVALPSARRLFGPMAVSDLVMMSKQLRVLKGLAERDASAAALHAR